MSILLFITVFLPVLGSVALALIPRGDDRMARQVAMGVALATLAFSLILLAAFRPQVEGPQFSSVSGGRYGFSWVGSSPDLKDRPETPVVTVPTKTGRTEAPVGERPRPVQDRPDIRVAFGLDGLSLWMFVLTSLLMITAICCSWESIKERVAAHFAFLLALETGLLGLFASLDIILFYIFFEFTLIPLFFLIGIWGGPQRRRASVTFFLYTLAGSLLTLLGVIALVVVH